MVSAGGREAPGCGSLPPPASPLPAAVCAGLKEELKDSERCFLAQVAPARFPPKTCERIAAAAAFRRHKPRNPDKIDGVP